MKRTFLPATACLVCLACLPLHGGCAKARRDRAAPDRDASVCDAAAAEVVELRFEERAPTGRGPYKSVQLDADGRGEVPFATRSGKLLLQLADGKVTCDANGDGKIDAADGAGVPASGPPARGGSEAAKRMVRIPIALGGRDVKYPVFVAFARKGYMVLASAAVLRGEFAGATLDLGDENLNGTFGEVGVDTFAASEGGESTPLPLGKTVAVAGELYDVEVITGGKAGASLRLSPYAGERATLVTKTAEGVTGAALSLAHVDGVYFGRAAAGDTLVLPAGTYKVVPRTLTFATPGKAAGKSAGPGPMLVADGGGDEARVTLRPGENELSPGPPFRLDFTAYAVGEGGRTVEIKAASLVGGAGERYRAQVYAQAAKSSLKSYVRAKGKEKELAKLEYG